MRDLLAEANFNFEVPYDIIEAVLALENAINERATYIDCLQDEIRNLAHCSVDNDLTYEQSEQIIDFFCRRRWL